MWLADWTKALRPFPIPPAKLRNPCPGQASSDNAAATVQPLSPSTESKNVFDNLSGVKSRNAKQTGNAEKFLVPSDMRCSLGKKGYSNLSARH